MKALSRSTPRQISNLAHLFAFLLTGLDIPLHFLKVLNFEELTKAQELFLYIGFSETLAQADKDKLKDVFRKGIVKGEKH